MAKAQSKIVSIELENFMAIKNATLTFDESNIINLKGYNDSGKSAITRALDVLFFNSYKNAQKNFIKHGEKYFRVIARFDDGISIIRDKYITGTSLYEMYEGSDLLFSTKVGSTLTQVKEVPLEIREYLGMTETSSGNYLNSQSIYDKQFLIQTTGSENVELLNGVLRLKETGLATTAIKNDINNLSSVINGLVADIESVKISLERYEDLDEGFILALSELDKLYDDAEARYRGCEKIANLLDESNSLVIDVPNLDSIEYDSYEKLLILSKYLEKLSAIPSVPELELIDSKSYTELLKIRELQNSLENYKGFNRNLDLLDSSALSDLEILYKAYQNFYEISGMYSSITAESERLEKEALEIKEYAMENSIAISKCDNCGNIVIGSAGHVHV